jgi:hypothetical protein
MPRSRDTRDLYRALARDNTPLLVLASLGVQRYGIRCRFASESPPKRCRAALQMYLRRCNPALNLGFPTSALPIQSISLVLHHGILA